MPLLPDGPSRSSTTASEGGGSVFSRVASPRSHRDLRLDPGTRRILHLDVDAFLASVEQALHPELAGKPVVVGGLPHERNLVMSCSYPARAFGVRPGMRLAEAARRCPQAIFRRGDSQAANRLREEVARIAYDVSPRVEVASIDDFFVDLTGAAPTRSAFDAAVALRAAIRDGTRLPVTIGIGTNRTLARLAGKLAKPGGVAEVLPGGEEAFLGNLPVEHLPGVGHSIGALLERFAIRTVGDLRQVSREVLFASFGRLGLVLAQRARGLDPTPVEPNRTLASDGTLVESAPATIRRDSTFEPEEGRRELVLAMLAYLVERAAGRARAHRVSAGALEVRVTYVDTRPAPELAEPGDDRPGGASFRLRRTYAEPSDSTDELARRASALFAQLPRRRALVKRIGLTLDALAPRAGWQRRLFGDADTTSRAAPARESRDDRHRRLDGLLDELRARHGFGRILRGSSVPLITTTELTRDGFRLRTPSLNQ
jgi:DNA polymerase-4